MLGWFTNFDCSLEPEYFRSFWAANSQLYIFHYKHNIAAKKPKYQLRNGEETTSGSDDYQHRRKTGQKWCIEERSSERCMAKTEAEYRSGKNSIFFKLICGIKFPCSSIMYTP